MRLITLICVGSPFLRRRMRLDAFALSSFLEGKQGALMRTEGKRQNASKAREERVRS